MSGRIAAAILALLLALPLGCQRSAKAPVQLDAELSDLRVQYAETYPDDPFLPTIAENRIVEGMGPTQVFLAWGRPVHRFKGDGAQKWIYEFSENAEAQPKTVAHLFFEHGELIRWKIDHGFVFFLDPETQADTPEDFGDLPGLGSPKQPDR